MTPPRIIGLDGHDGAGKTTLAKLLAQRLGAQYVRPFGGQCGADLMDAHQKSDHALTIAIGEAAIRNAITNTNPDQAIVLDRSWITVCTLVPNAIFKEKWTLWIPTVLCWSDLATTLQRLDIRDDEAKESIESHQHYLSTYLSCAQLKACPILRTDRSSVGECVDELETFALAMILDSSVDRLIVR